MSYSRLTTCLILTAFIGIAVFGFASMGQHGMNGHDNCIATVGQTALCTHQDPLGIAAAHSRFFQRMTSATGGVNVLALLAGLLALAGIVWLSLKYLLPARQQLQAFIEIRNADFAFATSSHPLLDWLTLHEKVGPALF